MREMGDGGKPPFVPPLPCAEEAAYSSRVSSDGNLPDQAPARRSADRASADGASFFLTVLGRGPALHLASWAAKAGLPPVAVASARAALSVFAFFLFWRGHYWLGSLAGLFVMVLDIVGGTSSPPGGAPSTRGNVLAHGVDLIIPPLWWWGWTHGLTPYGRPLEPVLTTMVLCAIIGGYALQRLAEGVFIRRFGGIPMHRWKRIDSRFWLIGAGRTSNLLILIVSLIFKRPDIGLELIAAWTIVSLIFSAVRLAQANERSARGMPVTTWLDG